MKVISRVHGVASLAFLYTRFLCYFSGAFANQPTSTPGSFSDVCECPTEYFVPAAKSCAAFWSYWRVSAANPTSFERCISAPKSSSRASAANFGSSSKNCLRFVFPVTFCISFPYFAYLSFTISSRSPLLSRSVILPLTVHILLMVNLLR